MCDLDPATIERLLEEAARRRGELVEACRDFIQAIADRAGVTFKAVQQANYFEMMPPGSSRLHPQEEAARYGVSVRSCSTTRTGNCPPTLICRLLPR